jgi:hypothetical protein
VGDGGEMSTTRYYPNISSFLFSTLTCQNKNKPVFVRRRISFGSKILRLRRHMFIKDEGSRMTSGGSIVLGRNAKIIFRQFRISGERRHGIRRESISVCQHRVGGASQQSFLRLCEPKAHSTRP